MNSRALGFGEDRSLPTARKILINRIMITTRFEFIQEIALNGGIYNSVFDRALKNRFVGHFKTVEEAEEYILNDYRDLNNSRLWNSQVSGRYLDIYRSRL